MPTAVIEYRRWVTNRFQDEMTAANPKPTNSDLIKHTTMEASSGSSQKEVESSDSNLLQPGSSCHASSLVEESVLDKNINNDFISTDENLQPDGNSTSQQEVITDWATLVELETEKAEYEAGKLTKVQEVHEQCFDVFKDSDRRKCWSSTERNPATEPVSSHQRFDDQESHHIRPARSTSGDSHNPHNPPNKHTHSKLKKLNNSQHLNSLSQAESINRKSTIGSGGTCQWSCDETSSRKSADFIVKHGEDVRKDVNNRRTRSPCEGISEHDLENARQARQLIISSPEKPFVKPVKWGKEDMRHFLKESRVRC